MDYLTYIDVPCHEWTVYHPNLHFLLDFSVKNKHVFEIVGIRQSPSEITTCRTHRNTKVLLLYRKAWNCITNSRSTPTLWAECLSHLWYLYPLRKASFSCLCESCLSCPLQQAAGSSDQRLQPLYSSLTEDTVPFSPIEPLRPPGGTDQQHWWATQHRSQATHRPTQSACTEAESTLSLCYLNTDNTNPLSNINHDW